MGELLEADVAALHSLSRKLSGIAGHIDAIAVDAVVEMPGLRIGTAAQDVPQRVVEAYRQLGASIRTMGEAAAASAATYEDTDQEFRDQLVRYEAGL